MKTNPYLVVSVESRSAINKMLDDMFSGAVVTYAGFKCKVTEIKVKEEGSKQHGTYVISAIAHLRLVESYETN